MIFFQQFHPRFIFFSFSFLIFIFPFLFFLFPYSAQTSCKIDIFRSTKFFSSIFSYLHTFNRISRERKERPVLYEVFSLRHLFLLINQYNDSIVFSPQPEFVVLTFKASDDITWIAIELIYVFTGPRRKKLSENTKFIEI